MFERIERSGLGIFEHGIVSTDQIVFSKQARDFCERNVCRNYGTTWACPPAVGSMEACVQICLSNRLVLVFSAKYDMVDSFDFDGMMVAHKKFKTVCDKLYEVLLQESRDFILLSNESCIRCNECNYPASPCRFPDLLFPAVEGYGILVSELAKSSGIHYSNGVNTVTYFGAVLFDRVNN
mgnify:CR=1 FL=1